jgi:hypothetical protein
LLPIRRPIARLYFNRKKALQVGLFKLEGEVKFDIEKMTDIFKFKSDLLSTIKQYQESTPLTNVATAS